MLSQIEAQLKGARNRLKSWYEEDAEKECHAFTAAAKDKDPEAGGPTQRAAAKEPGDAGPSDPQVGEKRRREEEKARKKAEKREKKEKKEKEKEKKEKKGKK